MQKDVETETAVGLTSLVSFVFHKKCGSSEYSIEKCGESHDFFQLRYEMD